MNNYERKNWILKMPFLLPKLHRLPSKDIRSNDDKEFHELFTSLEKPYNTLDISVRVPGISGNNVAVDISDDFYRVLGVFIPCLDDFID